MNRALIPLLLLPLTGCPDEASEDTAAPAVEAPDLSTLTVFEGCGDVFMAASNADYTLMLLYRHPQGLLDAVEGSGEAASSTVDLAVEGELTLYRGTELWGKLCSDYSFAEIDATWTATFGVAYLEVEPLAEGEDWPWATLDLEGAVLESPGVDPVAIDEMTWSADVGEMGG